MRAIGIILAGGNNKKMRELSHKRAIAAMPIAGSYRAIDFALSSMTNSNISKVAVFTQYNSKSLNEHLSSSKWWDFGRKQGGLYVFTPTIAKIMLPVWVCLLVSTVRAIRRDMKKEKAGDLSKEETDERMGINALVLFFSFAFTVGCLAALTSF